MELVTYPTLADSICDTRSRKINHYGFEIHSFKQKNEILS